MNKTIFLSLVLFICCGLPLSAQNQKSMSSITLINGEVVRGYIHHNDDGTYTVTSADGTVSFYSNYDVKEEAVAKQPATKNKKKKILRDDPRYQNNQEGFSMLIEGLIGTQFGAFSGGFSFVIGANLSPHVFLGGKLGFMATGRREGSLKENEYTTKNTFFFDRSVLFPSVDFRYSFRKSLVTPYIGASMGLSINRPQTYLKESSTSSKYRVYEWSDVERNRDMEFSGGYPGNCSFQYEISFGVRVRIPNPYRGYFERTSGWFGVALCGFSNKPALALKAGLSF